MSEALPPSVQAIRDNDEFVRRLARSLMRDPAAADDLAQDAWITALRQEQRPVASLRGWLAGVMRNRARDLSREAARRARREATSARSEVDDGQRAALDRIDTQKRVLDALVELPEAQRTAILLHHLDGLTCEEIAHKRGVAASTVRAQVSRGLDALRTRLDREFGERAAWSAALATLLGTGQRASAPITAGVLATLVVTVTGLGALAYVATRPSVTSSTTAATSSRAVSPEIASSTPVELEDSQLAPAALVQRDAREDASKWATQPDRATLEAASIDELLVLGKLLQRAVADRLLAVPDDQRIAAGCFTKEPDSGVGRVLDFTKFGTSPGRRERAGENGFGCTLSFLNGSNDARRDATLEFGRRKFSGPAGSAQFVPIGYQNMALFPDAASDAPPAGVSEAAWEFAWSELGDRVTFHERAKEAGFTRDVDAFVGGAWLVRIHVLGRFDVLAVFASLGADENGHSIGWRVLERWPVKDAVVDRFEPSAGAVPDWAATAELEDLHEMQDELSAVSEPILLSIPQDAFRDCVGLADCEVARLLDAPRFGPLLSRTGLGSYLSFATPARSFDFDADVLLAHGELRSFGAPADGGLLVDCGEVPLASIGGLGAAPPETLGAREVELWTLQRQPMARDRRDADAIVAALRPHGRARTARAALEGHSYALRVVHAAQRDVLAAFRLERRDAHGWFASWRLLELSEFGAPSKR